MTKRPEGFQLKTPCKNCPFANRPTRITFRARERAEEIAESAYRNGFPCHLSAELRPNRFDPEEEGYEFGGNTQHCAGAIGMFLNDGNSTWPGIDNDEDIPELDWSEAQAAAFESEEAFIEANTGELEPEQNSTTAAAEGDFPMNAPMNHDLTAPMTAAEVKQARLALGFKRQQELADALGLEGKYRKDTVRSWESGRVPISGPSRLALRMMLRDKGLLTPSRKRKPQSAPQQP